MEKLLSIPLELNFTPNTLGCYEFIVSVVPRTWVDSPPREHSCTDLNVPIRAFWCGYKRGGRDREDISAPHENDVKTESNSIRWKMMNIAALTQRQSAFTKNVSEKNARATRRILLSDAFPIDSRV